MNPMAQARGLQLALASRRVWLHDISPAGATLPRVQNRGSDVGHFPLATFPARNQQCSVGKVLFEPFAPSEDGVPEHADTIAHNRRAALTPALEGGASALQKGE
jgi:hypothetical protein